MNRPAFHESTLVYQPHVDGLRGIAVLLVIAYHLNIPPFSGGYIGVDIFFVISGYLITSLLRNVTPGLKSLAHFYERRLTRLQPVFVVFLVITTALAAFLLLPEDFLNYLRSAYRAQLVLSNHYFDQIARNYFAPDAHALPLLHTWSLAIEWHFYFLFPALFLLARKVFAGKTANVLLTLVAVGFALLSWQRTGNSQQAYFYDSARFVELLIGSVAASFRFGMPEFVRHTIAALALASLVGIATIFDAKTPFPGLNAMLVCLLAATTIMYGAGSIALRIRPLVHIGRISYSAYLWHWPIAAFLTYLQIPISPLLGILLLAPILGLAHLTYYWIEVPGRGLRMKLPHLLLLLWFGPLIISIAIFQVAKRHDGFPWRLGPEMSRIDEVLRPYDDDSKLGCEKGDGDWAQRCRFGKKDAASSAFLIGDSHAGHYRWFVSQLADSAGIRVVSTSNGECLMLPGASHAYRGIVHEQRCRSAIDATYDEIRKSHPRYVLLAQRWIGYPIKEVRKLEEAVDQLIALGATPVILGPVAEDGKDLKACFYRHIKLRKQYRGECSIARNNTYQEAAKTEIAHLFDSIARRHPQVIIIDPQAVQCHGDYCDGDVDGIPLYEDTHHINGYGSSLLARRYIEAFGNPLLHGR